MEPAKQGRTPGNRSPRAIGSIPVLTVLIRPGNKEECLAVHVDWVDKHFKWTSNGAHVTVDPTVPLALPCRCAA